MNENLDKNEIHDRLNMSELHIAALKGDYQKVKYLLSNDNPDNRKNINIIDTYKRTPLHLAVISFSIENEREREQRLDTIKWLLINGADFNAKDIWGGTPYHYAKLAEMYHVISLMKRMGANKILGIDKDVWFLKWIPESIWTIKVIILYFLILIGGTILIAPFLLLGEKLSDFISELIKKLFY